MRANRWVPLGFALAGAALHSQCFDLSSTHLYQPEGRFQEWWDQPIWNAPPGDGNFHLDQQEYGKHPLHFALFMGVVKKTEAGWIPFRRERRPIAVCDHSGPRGSGHCWLTPYETPNPDAVPNPYDHQFETWSMTKAGIVQYVQRARVKDPAGHSGTEDSVATLNLETGRYEMGIRNHGKGFYDWAVKGGVEFWRDVTFTAQAKLTPVDCPASLKAVSVRPAARRPKATEMEGLRPCVIKVKSKPGELRADFDFIQNPANAASPQGCVVVHDGPMPQEDLKVAQGAQSK